MNISVIGVNKANLLETINDSSVYVIKKSYFADDYQMIPIKKADVNDLVSDKVLIVRITKE